MDLTCAIKAFEFHCEYEKNLSRKTMQAYQTDLRQFEQYGQNGNLNINELDKHKLKEYVQSLYNQELKAKTIKRKLAVLKALFTYLEFDEIILVSPFRKMRVSIKEPRQLPKTIELKEIRKILKFIYRLKTDCTNTEAYSYKALVRDIVIIEILFSTGVRVSELCNIKSNNINIQSGTIKIRGKGDKERIIQICDSEVKGLLKEYYCLFGEEISLKRYFLVNRLGNQISEQSVRLMIKKYQKQSGVGHSITPHMFRHSFATFLLEEGVDIRYIQHMLGHSSISTTQIYTQVNVRQQKKILANKHPRRNLSFVAND